MRVYVWVRWILILLEYHSIHHSNVVDVENWVIGTRTYKVLLFNLNKIAAHNLRGKKYTFPSTRMDNGKLVKSLIGKHHRKPTTNQCGTNSQKQCHKVKWSNGQKSERLVIKKNERHTANFELHRWCCSYFIHMAHTCRCCWANKRTNEQTPCRIVLHFLCVLIVYYFSLWYHYFHCHA